jgi:beta-lactamase regulating signal transducer with metallopeptidase domain
MTDLLLQMGLSNACFSLAVASAAMFVGARARRPHLAYMLWLLVFVKMVTPPVVALPVAMPWLPAGNDNSPAATRPAAVSELAAETQAATSLAAHASSLWSNIGTGLNAAKPLLASLWLMGSVAVCIWSIGRVIRFSCLLREQTESMVHSGRARSSFATWGRLCRIRSRSSSMPTRLPINR